MDSYKQNKRLGIKVPRSTLLPPYLLINDYFTDYANSMDAVYGPLVDDKITAVSNLRNMWVQNPDMELTIQEKEMVDVSQWTVPERDIVVKQVNMLGMKLMNAGIVTDASYQTIARFVGIYWFEKGTEAFIEFINYCLRSDLRVHNLWTENYVDFLPEGDAGIGTPIWDGGTWYPTTHVEIEAKGGLKGLDIRTLQSFFYEIANYNLVLRSIDSSFDMYIVDRFEPDHITADIVAIAGYVVNEIAISNFKSYGTTAPPTYELNNGEWFPTTYLAMGSVDVDFNSAFLLGQPTGWIDLGDGKKIPVYSTFNRIVRDQAILGTQMMGRTLPFNEFNLVYGPVTWAKIPGSSRSSTRIPTFSTSTYTVKDGIAVSAQTVGARRNNFLVNPLGFVEIEPGKFSPYW